MDTDVTLAGTEERSDTRVRDEMVTGVARTIMTTLSLHSHNRKFAPLRPLTHLAPLHPLPSGNHWLILCMFSGGVFNEVPATGQVSEEGKLTTQAGDPGQPGGPSRAGGEHPAHMAAWPRKEWEGRCVGTFLMCSPSSVAWPSGAGGGLGPVG